MLMLIYEYLTRRAYVLLSESYILHDTVKGHRLQAGRDSEIAAVSPGRSACLTWDERMTACVRSRMTRKHGWATWMAHAARVRRKE